MSLMPMTQRSRQVDGEAFRSLPPWADSHPRDVALLRGVLDARAVLDRRTIHVADLPAEMEECPECPLQGARSS